MLTQQELAKQLCEMEGKKEEVNIAQMNEIVDLLPKLVSVNSYRFDEILQFLLSELDGDTFDVIIEKRVKKFGPNYLTEGYTIDVDTVY